MITVTVKETIHPLNTKRVRTLDKWLVVAEEDRKLGITVYRLRGRLLTEVDGSKPSLRWTTSSGIVSCTGNRVITESGSIYSLTPNPHSNQEIYSATKYIPDCQCTPSLRR